MLNFGRLGFWFDKESGKGGGGEPPPVDPPPEEPEVTPTGEEEPGEGDGETTPPEITLTPSQLSERLTRAKGSERKTLLAQFGFESVEEVEKVLKDGQEALRSKLSDDERAVADLKDAVTRADKAEDDAKKAESDLNLAEIRSEAIGLMAVQFVNPATAFKLLDVSNVQHEDSEFTGLQEAIDVLAENEPWTLVSETTKKKVAPAIGATNPPDEPSPKVSDEERRTRYFGGPASGGFFEGGGVKTPAEKTPEEK